MEWAAQLLLYSGESIKEISSQLGFHDTSHFIHTFKCQFNQTPGEHRKA